MAQKPRIFRFFVSSTFSDMSTERNVLQARVFPSLRRFCEANGARFQAIDLRWGISQEAGLNQRATDLCLNEIARCQRMTRRPNFLLLLGDRYGWQPLPDDIPADEWNVLTGRISATEASELFAWYRRDDNAVPSYYVLQPRQGAYTDQNTWNAVEKRLREVLRQALHGLDWSREQRMKYEASVTEQEIDAGIFQYAHAQDGALCLFRTIDGSTAANTHYRDNDPNAQERLADLKHRLEARLPDNIHRYQAGWAGDGSTFDEDAFCAAVESALQQMIEAELASFEDISPLENEAEAHRAFMLDHTRHFVGRVDVLDAVSRYLSSNSTYPLVLHGQSGVGKSTAMAKAIESAPYALYRFIGTTPESSDIRSVLVSLCESIRTRYGVTDAVPQEYEELIKAFPAFLAHASAENPLVIFLDALDQLANTNTPSSLRWLPNELPSNVKLVMSVIPNPQLDALKRRLPPESLVEILPMQAADGEVLLNLLLHSIGRTLQPMQRAEVLGKFAQNGLPLYLKLAFEEARLWHSYSADITLHPDVPSLLENNLFARLSDEAEHGAMLVSRSMAYLAASRNGLSEGEMIEVLTKDRGFWDDFEKKRTHEAQREALKCVEQLPIAVWSRLAFDLEPYLVERGADGAVLLNFYHRQFSETVDRLFLSPQREARHAHLASYFKEQQEYTARKVAEQAYQQAMARLTEAYGATLTDYPYLQACLNVRGVHALIEDCTLLPAHKTVRLIRSALNMSLHALAVDKLTLAHQLDGRLDSFSEEREIEALRLTCKRSSLISPLDNGYSFLFPAGGSLLTTLPGHGEYGKGAMALSNGRLISWSDDGILHLWNSDGTSMAALVGHSNAVLGVLELRDGRLLSWSGEFDRSLRLWTSDGIPLEVLAGHSGGVSGALELDDGRLLSWSASDLTLRVWTSNGELLSVMSGHTNYVWGAIILDDEQLLSWSWDKTLRVWSSTGTLLRVLEGHSEGINGVLKISNGCLLSWSGGGELRLWASNGMPFGRLAGHTDSVQGAIELTDGRILSWSRDKTLRLWASNGTPLGRLVGHTSDVNGALELVDGRVLSWSNDRTLRLWSTEGDSLAVLTGHMGFVKGALQLDDGRIVSWSSSNFTNPSNGNTLRLWSRDGALLEILDGHTTGVECVLDLGDGRLLSWAGNGDSLLRLWSVVNSGTITTSQAHAGEVIGLLPLPHGKLLSWARGDTMAHVWSTDGSLLGSLKGHTNAIWHYLQLKDGRLLSWSKDNTIRLWASDGTLLSALTGHNEIRNVIELSDGRLLSWANDATLRLWSAEGKLLAVLVGHTSSVYGVLALSNGCLLSWSPDTTLRLWSASGKPLMLLEGHNYTVSGALELSDGRLISWSEDNTLRLWSASGIALGVLEGHSGHVSGALELPNGNLVSWCKDHDGTIRLWTPEGVPLAILDASYEFGGVHGVVTVPGGRLLSRQREWGNRHYSVKLWSADAELIDIQKGILAFDLVQLDRVSLIPWLWSHELDPLILFPNDPALNGVKAAFSDDSVFLYDARSGIVRTRFVGDDRFTRLAMLDDGRTMAAGDERGRVIFLRYNLSSD